MKNKNKVKEDYVRLIISDLHLGSAYSKEKQLYNFLSNTYFDEIILAGDIIELLRNPLFTEYTYKIFNEISSRGKPIIYIVGNHDDTFESFIGHHIGDVQFVKEYEFEYAGRKYRIQHGDQYSAGITQWRYTMQFISFVQNLIERVFNIDLTTWWAKKQIKKRKLIRIWDLVQWNSDADVFIMGHTHNPEVLIWVDKNEEIKTYVNTGDWVDNCTYVLIKDGQVRLRKFE
tara:strand:- start:260 stop:949 length:690 start_codon:yes stop_codon:yes gene_type:complete